MSLNLTQKPNLKLQSLIKSLGQNNQSQQQQNLPTINQKTFIKKTSRKSSIQSAKSKQFFHQNDFKLHAIYSRKSNNHFPNNPNNHSFSKIMPPGSNTHRLDNNKNTKNNKRRSQSGIILGVNKIKSGNQVQDLYQQYLTMEQVQANKAKHQLQKKIQKFMPKNSSFSQFYGQKIRMVQKQAEKQQKQINQQIFKHSQTQNHHNQNKQKSKKLLLLQILNNKTINFRNKIRSRSYQKRSQTPKINVMQTIQRDNTSSHMDFLNSPTYSQTEQLKIRLQFFPQPKSPRFTRFLGSNMIGLRIKNQTISYQEGQDSAAKKYIQKIRSLQQISQKQTKRSQYLINSSIKKQGQFEKEYKKLDDQAIEAIYGFSELKLQQETSDSFKDQLREMWMKNDLSKGKGRLVKKNK